MPQTDRYTNKWRIYNRSTGHLRSKYLSRLTSAVHCSQPKSTESPYSVLECEEWQTTQCKGRVDCVAIVKAKYSAESGRRSSVNAPKGFKLPSFCVGGQK